MRRQRNALRASWKSGVLLAAAAAGCGWAAPAAMGQVTFLNDWGSAGTGNNQFKGPDFDAVGPDGTVYVGDQTNNRIEYFGATGTFQGTFAVPSVGTSAPSITGVAVGPSGTVYVADAKNERIDMFNSTGASLGNFGSAGSGSGEFTDPNGLAVDTSGNVFVVDNSNGRVDLFSGAGTFLGTFPIPNSTGNNQGMALGPQGSIYTTDVAANVVNTFSSTGVFQSRFGGSGTSPGDFSLDYGVTVGQTGLIYVTDFNNGRIETFGSTGTFQSSFGSSGNGAGQFNDPIGAAVAPTGMIYVVELVGDRVDRLFDAGSWVSGSNTFTNSAIGPTALSVGTGQILGTSLTLNPAMGLTANSVAVAASGTLTQAGGSLSLSGGLTVNGAFNYLGGPFGVGTITVGGNGTFLADEGSVLVCTTAASVSTAGAVMSLDGGTLLSAPALSVGGGGVIIVGQATVAVSGTLNNLSGGEVQLANQVSAGIQAGTIQNAGLIDGSGRISAMVANNSGGEISVGPGQNLTIFGAGNTNGSGGLISLAGGLLHYNQTLTNNAGGMIEGFGQLRVDGGLSNGGMMALAGAATVSGPVSNAAGGVVELSGNAPNVFAGAVNNAGSLIVDAGASGSLFGAYSGGGSITNNGVLFVHAGAIAGPISGGGNLTLGAVGSPTTLQLISLNTGSTQGSVTINGGSTLDVANNSLTLNYGSAAGDPVGAIAALLANGYNGGTWSGAGITSSSAAGNPSMFALGYADGNSDPGTAAGANQLVVEYTLAGDANLNGTVDFADLVSLAQNFGFTGRDWAQGNFTYDPSGSVGFADLVLLAQNFGFSTGVAAGKGGGLALSPAWEAASVPEPGGMGLMMGIGGLLGRRRRRVV